MKELISSAEQDPDYGGYVVMTVHEGDCLIIGDAIVRLKRVKTNQKVAIAIKARRHILVRRVAEHAPQTKEL